MLLIGLVAVSLLVGVSAVTAVADEGPGPTAPVAAGATHSGNGFEEHRGASGEVDVNVCSYATPPGVAHCDARIRTDAAAPQVGSGPGAEGVAPAALPGGAYGPSDLQAAYGTVTASATLGAGRTVAVVDAYDDPNAESDLATYRAAAGLPPCTTANGCFRKVDQNGNASYPVANVGWAQEISLDLDMVSAMCPGCNILLVEANSTFFSDLGLAVNRAVSLGTIAISNSYGGSEFSSESSYGNSYFNHPGVAVTASSGDSGYGVEYPAASPNVIAVGGTSLHKSGSAFTETAWSGAGSGCSAYEPKPSWQLDTGCTNRTVADVSAVADPSTGVLVYDSYGVTPGWYAFGGTSVASPIIASIAALAGGPWANPTASYLYGQHGALHDVVSGSNGSCGTYLCNAVAGFDGPTGLGTPNTTAAFVGASVAPDFSVNATPSSVSLSPGGNGSSTIALTAQGGLTGMVNLSVAPASDLSPTLSPSSVDLSSATPRATLTFPAGSPGTHTVIVRAVSQADTTLVHTATVTVITGTIPGAPTIGVATAGNGQASVTFTAPGDDGGSPVTAYTVSCLSSNGGATGTASGPGSPVVVGGLTNGKAYTCSVTATNVNGTGAASDPSNSFVPSYQTITFGTLAAKTTTQPPFTVSATASSGLVVTFTTTTPSVCTSSGTSGRTITLVGAGLCTVVADQAGNGTYGPAPSVIRSFTVSKATQTITFGTLAAKTTTQPPFTVSATASSGLVVTFTTTTPSVCTSSGTSGRTITLVGAGLCTVVADQAGNGTYGPAPSVIRSFTVSKATQTITFGTLAAKTTTQPPFTVSATASSGLVVTFTTTTPSVCTSSGTSGRTITLVGAGLCTVVADQAGNGTYGPAPSVIRSFTVSKATQTITFGTLAAKTTTQPPFTVSATASSGLVVTFTTMTPWVCTSSGTNGQTITLIARGTCTVKANQAGNATYGPAASASRYFTVSKATQTITFGTLAAKTRTQPPFTVSATASSGLVVTFTSMTPWVCTSSGTNGQTITLIARGTCTVRASQGGNASYNSAPSVNGSFTVS